MGKKKKDVELGSVFVTLDSGRRIRVNIETQVMEAMPITIHEINEVNTKLAAWQKKHKISW